MDDPIADVDIVFLSGAFTTLDNTKPEVEAVAVRDGRFVAVGSNAEVRAHAGDATRVVDLGGRRVVPGLIDAHCHPVETLWMKDDWVDARYPGTDSVATTKPPWLSAVQKEAVPPTPGRLCPAAR